jgi:hypothetical protein
LRSSGQFRDKVLGVSHRFSSANARFERSTHTSARLSV